MVIGLTGGIGAGKSAVMEYLQEKGCYTILADDVARKLQEKGGVIYNKMLEVFGTDILGEDGQLDRNSVASVVFSDEKRLSQLNAIVHPAVREKILSLIAENKDKYPHIVIEAALLIEEHYEDVVDELWYVDAADEIRIKRLMENRGYTREKCLSIMNRQLSREEYVRHCKVVLDNSTTLDEVRAQVDQALIETKQEGETDASNL